MRKKAKFCRKCCVFAICDYFNYANYVNYAIDNFKYILLLYFLYRKTL